MLHILPATSQTLPFIKELYEQSFPIHERRLWSAMLSISDEPEMNLNVIKDADDLIGFVIWWQIEEWLYIEHIAIDPLQRGKQYGSKIIELLIEKSANKLILEVEPPHDSISLKRIKFYERLNLAVIPFPYKQPPYRRGEDSLPMLLMSTPQIVNKEEFIKLSTAIKERVYERFS
ncbi:GNAT family N-acetyltransferase [Chitinophagaceae bacterium LWZ2-11]